MFNVGDKTYTVKFSQEKFKELAPKVSAAILIELVSSANSKNIMSDSSLKHLFVIGLEEEKTGMRIPIHEANKHFEKLLANNETERFKSIVAERFYNDMPDFFKAMERKSE